MNHLLSEEQKRNIASSIDPEKTETPMMDCIVATADAEAALWQERYKGWKSPQICESKSYQQGWDDAIKHQHEIKSHRFDKIEKGVRKMNKPEIISEDEIDGACTNVIEKAKREGRFPSIYEMDSAVAQRQRDADVSWFVKWLKNFPTVDPLIEILIKALQELEK